jgi:hypothetical protein
VIWLNDNSLFARVRDVDVRLDWTSVGATATAARERAALLSEAERALAFPTPDDVGGEIVIR